MKKPVLPSALPAASLPVAFVPVGSAGGPLPPSKPAEHVVAAPAEYVDPYLFETGFFESRAEYEQLMRTAPILSRAEAEAPPKRRKVRG